MKNLYIIDANALLYRSYFAIRGLTAPDGTPTNALLGFLRKLLQVTREKSPDALAVIFDGPGPSFRKSIFSDYKAHRSPMPDDLYLQFKLIQELIPALGMKFLALPEVEADDVIASLALKASAARIDVDILSGDKDLAALVRVADEARGRITLLAPSREIEKEKVLDPAGVMEKFGVPADAIPDLLTLMGDSSDNIPGVAGIGEKTAAKLIREHGRLDELLAKLDRLPPRIKTLFERSMADLELSRTLVKLKTDIDLPLDPEEYPASIALPSHAIEKMKALGFHNLLKELGEIAPSKKRGGETASAPPEATASSIAIPPTLLLNDANVADYLRKLASSTIAAVDTETTSLEPRSAELVGISFHADAAGPAYLPVSHADASASPETLARVFAYLRDPAAKKCGHNIKYDLQVLRGAGVDAAGFAFDSMVGAALAEPGKLSYSLDTLAKELFNHDTIRYDDLGGEIRNVPVEKAGEYAGQDAFLSHAFASRFRAAVDADEEVKRVYNEIEHPLIAVLAEMEWNGVYVNRDSLAALDREFSVELDELKSAVWREAKGEFNLDSPKQVAKVLFEDLGLEPIRKTKSGQSTDQETLEALAPLHPLPALLLEYRELAKLLSTYIRALPELINPKTNRLHTSFSQVRTATGRLASSRPNLQNIPIRSHRGRRIRKAFVAQEGGRFVAADYSQIEFRMMAFMSGDLALQKAFKSGKDFHAATAERLFDADLPLFSFEDARRKAKTVNFGILYGQSAFGLARTLGISRFEAAEMIKDYFAAFPSVKAWMESVKEKARADGFVRTLFGRKRSLPDLNSKSRTAREAAERMAINTTVQGTAADVIKIAMNSLFTELSRAGIDAKVVLQIHDEIIVEAGTAAADEVGKTVSEKMKMIPVVGEILEVNVGDGSDWLEASH